MHTVKLVQEKDIEKLAIVFADAFTVADPEHPWDYQHASAYLEYWLKKQSDMFYGAFDQAGNIVGAMAVNIKPWRTGVRCNDGFACVDINYQKNGIGKQLFKKVISEALEKHNVTIFEGVTFAGEIFPLTWYKRIGISVDEHAVVIKGDCNEILQKLGE